MRAATSHGIGSPTREATAGATVPLSGNPILSALLRAPDWLPAAGVSHEVPSATDTSHIVGSVSVSGSNEMRQATNNSFILSRQAIDAYFANLVGGDQQSSPWDYLFTSNL